MIITLGYVVKRQTEEQLEALKVIVPSLVDVAETVNVTSGLYLPLTILELSAIDDKGNWFLYGVDRYEIKELQELLK
jgi:hypothetical protein